MFFNLSVDYTMKVAFPPRKKAKKHSIRVGVFFVSNCFYYTLITANDEINSGVASTINELIELLTVQYRCHLQQIVFISVLPQHLIWRKSVYVSQPLHQYALEQQLYHILENDLPNDGAPIWFDYLYRQESLDVYVIKQQSAEQELGKYSPLSLQVLDVLPRTLLRAFRYLSGKSQQEKVLYCFCAEQLIFLVDSPNKTEMLFSQEDFAASWHKLASTFAQNCSSIIILQTAEQTEIDFTVIEQRDEVQILPTMAAGEFITLGCVLWGLDV